MSSIKYRRIQTQVTTYRFRWKIIFHITWQRLPILPWSAGAGAGAEACDQVNTVPLRRNLTGNADANGYRTGTERVREREQNGYRTDTEQISNGYRMDTEW